MAGNVLGVFENVGVAAAGGGSASFLEFVVGGIGETEEGAFEMFVEFGFFGEVLEASALGFTGRIEKESAVADKDSAGNHAVDGSDETDRTGTETEGAGIALEVVIGERNRFGA